MTDPFATAAAALAEDAPTAERLARALIAAHPGDPRPRLILASALRRRGDAGRALPILTDLARAYPRAARTRYELGLALGMTGQPAEGVAQLDVAVQLDPHLIEAWEALSDAAFAIGDYARETTARAALARLTGAEAMLAALAEQVTLGHFDRAEPRLRAHLLAHPDDVEALRLLAACYVAARAYDDAETLQRHALAIDPTLVRTRFDLAHTLFARQQAEAALAELAPLEAGDPDNPAYQNLRAGCLALLGDDQGAEALHGMLAARYPRERADRGQSRPCAAHQRAPRPRDRRLSPGARARSAQRRSVVEPRQPEDRRADRRRRGRDARAAGGRFVAGGRPDAPVLCAGPAAGG
ncbi:MAG: tetratricopeptide repeat protein [Sphingomonas adhaesiva]